ncbi:L,D-transpeptidase family protein [Pseudooceanicola nanhaiensis]|uniref:L,D-transpeptidase family protein n=1 Tax=Pseudooceanicola nanhaiensis TaxID=375761 RepID=UPI001CD2B37F|nr:L,D-transpeptidase family protein [Pseudooceanicola nanhaiensis]MCA0920890.1 L,D-transpeptidase family protein [Pseudooceanicola nanhaiensis]
MSFLPASLRVRRLQTAVLALAVALPLAMTAPSAAEADVSLAFRQAVAETASRDREMAAFYRETGFAPIWTGTDAAAQARRQALVQAIAGAGDHGLPVGDYDLDGLLDKARAVRSERDLGLVEVGFSKLFLRYARDVQTGMVTPSKIDPLIVREIPYRDHAELLAGVAGDDPSAFMRSLPPRTHEYLRLMRAKLDMEKSVAAGGWGPVVTVGKLEPGAQGRNVVLLRNRLIAMGYMERSLSDRYDSTMTDAIRAFQADHGLAEDGVAGPGTIGEINVSMADRLRSVMVAMERERWMNKERGDRHILVNLTDFHAKIIDHGITTFETRSVIGKNIPDRRTPEFSDEMEYLVINPTWNVPRSIAVKEYLPMFQKNPNAASHLNLINARGQVVNRAAVNFSALNARNFPFDIKQPPSSRNALGLVKFMFPNKYNIYLHDTPSKSLFDREVRDFSHGCIRLQQPFDFAYALLAVQEDDPEAFFQSKLRTGRETRVNLETPVPVHLIYRTAVTEATGKVTYRRDIYGRDARIWEAMQAAGVALRGVQG